MTAARRTEHEVVVGDARSMDRLADDSVELVVTSPPYPTSTKRAIEPFVLASS